MNENNSLNFETKQKISVSYFSHSNEIVKDLIINVTQEDNNKSIVKY
jgi:hypothetical protein